MMNRRPRQHLLLIVLLTFLLGLPSSAGAALDDSLQELFDSWGLSTTSDPGAYESQSRGYLSGGSATVRFYNQPFRAFSVAPPRFSAGCSGIDLYLGSFSYGKLDRYVDLLQQLGTGAVLGFAFQLAIKELCEPCADVLNKLESASRLINSMGRLQPCEAGKAIGAALAGDENAQHKVSGTIENAWQRFKEAGGEISDIWEDRDSAKEQTPEQAISSMADSDADPRGNLVWMVLTEAGVDADTARMVMSALGTIIVTSDGTVDVWMPVISVDDLLSVETGIPLRVYECADGTGGTQCLALNLVTVTDVDGFNRRVLDSMTTILEKLHDGTALTAEDQEFVGLIPSPVYRILADTTQPIQVGQAVIARNSDIFAADMALQWLKWARNQGMQQINKVYEIRRNYAGDVALWKAQANRVIEEARQELIKRTEGQEAVGDIVRDILLTVGNQVQITLPTK